MGAGEIDLCGKTKRVLVVPEANTVVISCAVPNTYLSCAEKEAGVLDQ